MFLVFAGAHGVGGQLGGWNDFQAKADTLDDAAAAVRDLQENNWWAEWWHIVDVNAGRVVMSSESHILLDYV
jgi:mono/diheme cytochrome c family protein